jgi:hypothetical protein
LLAAINQLIAGVMESMKIRDKAGNNLSLDSGEQLIAGVKLGIFS